MTTYTDFTIDNSRTIVEVPLVTDRRRGRPRLVTLVDVRVQSLFGLDFVTDSSIDQVVKAILSDSAVASERWRVVVTPNVDHLVRYERYPAEREVAQKAYLVLPDGAPIIWASRLLRKPISGRLAGSDLFPLLWAQLGDDHGPVVAIVGSQRVADALSEEHRTAEWIVPPLFDVGDDAAIVGLVDQIVSYVSAHRTEFVVMGLSMSKQHRLAAELMSRPVPRLGAPILLLLGASTDFHAGVQTRAPEWMRRLGIEWTHRLAMNPRAMAKRYLVDDMAFIRTVWREYRSLSP